MVSSASSSGMWQPLWVKNRISFLHNSPYRRAASSLSGESQDRNSSKGAGIVGATNPFPTAIEVNVRCKYYNASLSIQATYSVIPLKHECPPIVRVKPLLAALKVHLRIAQSGSGTFSQMQVVVK